MGSSGSGCLVCVGVGGTLQEDPLKPAPGGRGEGEGAVENSVYFCAVAPPLGSSVAADVRIVTGDENGAPPVHVPEAAREAKSKVDGCGGTAGLGELAAGRAR